MFYHFFYPIISSFLIFKVSAYGESHQSLSAFLGYGRVWIGFCNKLITNVILSSVRQTNEHAAQNARNSISYFSVNELLQISRTRLVTLYFPYQKTMMQIHVNAFIYFFEKNISENMSKLIKRSKIPQNAELSPFNLDILLYQSSITKCVYDANIEFIIESAFSD